jgi:hypothetical protein
MGVALRREHFEWFMLPWSNPAQWVQRQQALLKSRREWSAVDMWPWCPVAGSWRALRERGEAKPDASHGARTMRPEFQRLSEHGLAESRFGLHEGGFVDCKPVMLTCCEKVHRA